MHKQNEKEKGVVSILSVIFFILLMSVLTIGFLRIMTDEQSQVVDDDLTKGALASAQSGVEDAKRALVYCRGLTDATARSNCYAALNNANCPGMFGPRIQSSGATNPLITQLGLDATAGDGSIRVGNPANNQRYTCVLTQLQTSDVVGQASESLGELIPLRASSQYNRVTVYWQQSGTDGNVALPGAADLNDNYRYSEWKNGANVRFASVLRLQLVEFDRAKTLTQMQDSSAGMFLHPTSNTGYTATAPLTITNPVRPGSIGDKRVEVRCSTTTLQKGYACAMRMHVPVDTPADTKEYYLLVRSVYGAPHYRLELSNGGSSVMFDDVQPQVDSTGAAGDVFRRVISRVSYGADTFMTTNAVESGVSLCKDFFVTDTAATSPSGCVVSSVSTSGNAGVGGVCDIDPVACGPGSGSSGGTTPVWRSTIVNLSNNDPGTVAGCNWVITDVATNQVVGTITNQYCNYGDRIGYDFPPDPAYDGPPDPLKKRFDVALTVNLRSGGQVISDPYPFYLPRYPL